MRFVALAVIMLSLPLFISLLRQAPARRAYAITVITALFLGSGFVQIDAAIITWPMWSGTVKGVQISFIDMLALALIFTRQGVGLRIPLISVLLFYLLTLVLSLFQSSVAMATFFSCFQFLRLIVLFVAIAPELENPKNMSALVQGLAIGLMLQGASVINEKGHGVAQAGGKGFHRNTLGIMTELAMMPVIGAILGGQRNKILVVGALSALVIAASGGSRATLGFALAGATGLLLLSLVQHVTPIKMKVLGLSSLVALAIIPIGLATLNARFGGGAMVGIDDQRDAMENSAKAMSADHPMGVGSNMYVNVGNMQGYSARAGVSWGGNTRAAPVHNTYLLARAEIGWLGEFAFICLLVIPILCGLRHAFRYRRSLDGSICLGSAVALTVVALHLNVEFAGQVYFPQALILINISIIAGAMRLRRMGKKNANVRRPIQVGQGNRSIAGAHGRTFN